LVGVFHRPFLFKETGIINRTTTNNLSMGIGRYRPRKQSILMYDIKLNYF
jgi:hypothetical protein